MLELYAQINPQSRYANQHTGTPFPVRLAAGTDGYIFEGGPGGYYRYSDLQLFTKSGDQLTPIPHIAATPEGLDVITMVLTQRLEAAQCGHLYPPAVRQWAGIIRDMLDQIQRAAEQHWDDEED